MWIMSRITNWFKRKAAMLSLSMSNVEKNAFGQNGQMLSDNVGEVQRHNQGDVMDDLINGRVTQEVQDLRWRTYKVMAATENLVLDVNALKKHKTDLTDENAVLEIVVDNTTEYLSTTEAMAIYGLNSTATPTIDIRVIDNEKTVVASHGVIDGNNYHSFVKPDKRITVHRNSYPKFNIENYTKMLHVKSTDTDKKLLEFYVSKYPVEEDRKTYMFIKEVQKLIVNPISSNIINIDSVEFITQNCLGKPDHLKFKYENLVIHKVTEFNGYYVIKFYCDETIDGESIFEKYREEELDNKYKNKERKNESNNSHTKWL
jgi:hypothetical protein